MTRHLLAALFMVLCAVSTRARQEPNRFVLASVFDALSQTPVPGVSADDFIVQQGGTKCDTVSARPAEYPVAILVDTSHAARREFSEMRKAVRRLIGRMSGRDVSLYTFGDRAFRVVDYTRDTSRLERAVDKLFALPESESHVLDAIIEASQDISRREPAVAMIIVVSAGANDQSNRTPAEVFGKVMASRSVVQIVEMRTINASGRLGNVRGRRNFTSDRAAEAALGLQEVLQAIAGQTHGDYDRVFSASGYHASLERLQRRLAAEVFVEYVPAADPAAPLRFGTSVPGAAVRAIGLDRAPR